MQTIYLNPCSCLSGSYRVIVGAELPGSRPLDPRDRIIARYAEDQRTNINFKQRLKMKLDRYLGSCVQRSHRLKPCNSPSIWAHILGRYWSAKIDDTYL
jgi:hypothetical protein